MFFVSVLSVQPCYTVPFPLHLKQISRLPKIIFKAVTSIIILVHLIQTEALFFSLSASAYMYTCSSVREQCKNDQLTRMNE